MRRSRTALGFSRIAYRYPSASSSFISLGEAIAELMTSGDGGGSWAYPRVLLDGPIDVRDASLAETAEGAILITTFTSLAYEPILARAEKDGDWEPERLARWRAANNRLSAERRKTDLGVWMIRSTDDG